MTFLISYSGSLGIILRLIDLVILLFFNAIYIGKMIFQKKRGITTDQMKSSQEKVMNFAIYSVVFVKIISILYGKSYLWENICQQFLGMNI